MSFTNGRKAALDHPLTSRATFEVAGAVDGPAKIGTPCLPVESRRVNMTNAADMPRPGALCCSDDAANARIPADDGRRPGRRHRLQRLQSFDRARADLFGQPGRPRGRGDPAAARPVSAAEPVSPRGPPPDARCGRSAASAVRAVAERTR